MEREEALKLMKENSSKGKEYERFALLRGDNLAVCIAMLVGIGMILLKLIVKKEFDFGVCAVVFLATCIQSINEGTKLKKWWLIAFGIFEGLIAFVMFIAFIGGVLI